ncbi:hypothetical protein B7495_03820 [Cryobacterium sp. LW097]|nr:hypothetical protein B7495_03820 [Cryobacterium sp. LW097]
MPAARVRPARSIRALDHTMFDRVSRPTSARFDRSMVGLSSLADHGKLWAAAGAVLVATGHRSAAARGITALSIASLTANLFGKQFFGGSRPLLSRVPRRRRLPRPPTSATFPSGHSASAFAFAVGASLDDPRLAMVFVPMAVAVAYSRLHTGSHWFSDVVGGALLGTAIAAADAALHRRRAAL